MRIREKGLYISKTVSNMCQKTRQQMRQTMRQNLCQKCVKTCVKQVVKNMSRNAPGSRISSNLRTPDHLGRVPGQKEIAFFAARNRVFRTFFEVAEAQEHSQNDPGRFLEKKTCLAIFGDVRRNFRGDMSWHVMTRHDMSWHVMTCYDSWFSVNHHEFPWLIMNFHDSSWIPMKYRYFWGELMATKKIWWNLQQTPKINFPQIIRDCSWSLAMV